MAKEREELEDEMKDEEEEVTVILGPGEEIPKGEEEDSEMVKRLRSEINELKQKGDSAQALKESFVELGDVLKKTVSKGEEGPVLQPQQGESEEDFWKRVEKELWTDKTSTVLREAIRKEVAQLSGPTSGLLLKQAEKLMELDPDKGTAYRQYKDEIREFIRGLPKAAQANPDVFEYAYGQVAVRHIDDIALLKANELLEKRGIIGGKNGDGKPAPTYSEVPGKVASGAEGKRRYVKKEWIDESERRGIPLDQIIRMRSGQ